MANLCFGGTFNPIHCGHLICARAAAEAKGFEKVILIPSAHPPHKPPGIGLASPTDRLAMCRLAVEGDPMFEVDDIELQRTGPSYTIETARQLRRRGPPAIHWLIGADMLRLLPKWHEPEALLKEVNFILLARPGWTFDWATMPPAYRHLVENVVQSPLVEISATTLRQRVTARKSIAYLTPAKVVEYIERRQLYV